MMSSDFMDLMTVDYLEQDGLIAPDPEQTRQYYKNEHQIKMLNINKDLQITLKKIDIKAQIKMKTLEIESKERCIIRELELKYKSRNPIASQK